MTDFQFASTDVLNNLGSAAVRYKQNLQALKLLRTLKDQGGTPTTAEQTILSRYVGWGSSELINKAFPKSELGEPTKEIEALLNEDEIIQLRSSSLSAFFTPLPIIAAVYDVLDYLGLGVNEAARVGAAAAGGEILVTTATLAASRRASVPGPVRSLELKGLTAPVEVSAIDWR